MIYATAVAVFADEDFSIDALLFFGSSDSISDGFSEDVLSKNLRGRKEMFKMEVFTDCPTDALLLVGLSGGFTDCLSTDVLLLVGLSGGFTVCLSTDVLLLVGLVDLSKGLGIERVLEDELADELLKASIMSSILLACPLNQLPIFCADAFTCFRCRR